MDKKIAGLLGAAAALATISSVQAAPAQTTVLPQATSYRDLLDPVSNAMPLLKADDARLAEKRSSEGTEVAQITVQVGHHHHHHHHHQRHITIITTIIIITSDECANSGQASNGVPACYYSLAFALAARRRCR